MLIYIIKSDGGGSVCEGAANLPDIKHMPLQKESLFKGTQTPSDP